MVIALAILLNHSLDQGGDAMISHTKNQSDAKENR
jgi:hypothetical protein